MSVDGKKTLAYAAITITCSLLISLGITVTFNYTYVNQQFTNIYNTLANIQEQVSELPKDPVIINVTVPQSNVTEPIPTPVPVPEPKPTCDADEFYNATLNECTAKPTTPTPTPVPTPAPTAKPITFTVVGDVEGSSAGTSVFNRIKSMNATYDFVLGDLGYDNDLDWFKSTYGTLGDKMYCVIGNHDAKEDADSDSIIQETKEFCGESYWFKDGVSLFLFFDTNGDLNTQATKATALLKNQTVIQGTKNVFVLSHKPCATAPNSHHPLSEEPGVKVFCDKLDAAIPDNIRSMYLQAHNHVYSESGDKKFITSGAGGRSHYTCGTSSGFPVCDNTHYGFVKVYVTSDGKVATQFIDYNGKVIH